MKKFRVKSFGKMLVCLLISVFVCLSVSFFAPASENLQTTHAENDAETKALLEQIYASDETIDIAYETMLEDYFIDVETQLSTEFCWIFASQKALETAFLKQEREWYDFSEIATAYLYYKQTNRQNAFNTMGNIYNFLSVASGSGLVLENDVSSDLLLKINDATHQDYDYISNFASKNYMESTSLVSIGSNKYFSDLGNTFGYSAQIEVVQKFIKNYGGVFLAFGNGDGIVYNNGSLPVYNHTSAGFEYNDHISMNQHAVCLIGWNEVGFLALNSSYPDDDYSIFCIPYDRNKSKLDELLPSAKGFKVGGETSVRQESQDAGKLKNVFETSDDVGLSYQIGSEFDLNQVKIEIFRGTEDVTYNFDVAFNISASKINISSRFANDKNIAGGYVVRFFENSNQIATKSFVIVAGTEVASVSLEIDELLSTTRDSLALNSSFLTSQQTMTMLINPNDKYFLKINLSEFARCRYLASDPNFDRFKNAKGYDALFEISSVYAQSVAGDVTTKEETPLKVVASTISYEDNLFEFKLPSFLGENAVYQNKLLTFDITFNSTKLNGEKFTMTFFMFIGAQDGLTSSQNNNIVYHLGGGKNSPENITNYPNYQTNGAMTYFMLKNPTKSGYEFLGWFADDEFKTQVFKISDKFSDTLVLYAKWDSADISSYVKTSISFDSIKDYGGTDKSNQPLEYGDTLNLFYNFVPQGELAKYSYTAKLTAYYVFGGTRIYHETLNNQVLTSAQNLLFAIGYPLLQAGNYDVVVEASIKINNVANLESAATYKFAARQREVALDVKNSQVEYDGMAHFPEILPKENQIIEPDQPAFALEFNMGSQTSAGVYEIRINANNKNYKIADEFVTTKFVIDRKHIDVVWANEKLVFNTQKQQPKFEFDGVVAGDVVYVSLKANNFVNAGKYTAQIDTNSISNKNYFVNEETFDFEIIAAKIVIKLKNVDEKLRVAPEYRKMPEFEVFGDIFDGQNEDFYQNVVNSLNVTIESAGLAADKFGDYAITGAYDNPNFDAEIINAVYSLSPPYKVFYKLPDGRVYEEEVGENEQPKGVSREIFGHSIFQRLEYSQPLYGDGTENLHITVTVKDYTAYVVIGAAVAALVIVYLIITRKQRKNKVS